MLKKILNNALLVFIGVSIGFSSVANAYDCTDVPDFPSQTGASIANGGVYKNGGRAYRCLVAGWCTSTAYWAYEPGVGAYWNMAWEDLGACDAVTVNTPPSASLGAIIDVASGAAVVDESLVIGREYTFSASTSDLESNIVSWKLTVYLDTIDGLQNPAELDFGSSVGAGTANMMGNWRPLNPGSYVLVATATDSEGLEARVSRSFGALTTATPTLSLRVPEVAMVGATSGSTAIHWSSSTPFPSTPSMSFEGQISGLHTGNTSSSGGPPIGYQTILEYSWIPVEVGPLVVTASNGTRTISKTVDVLPAGGMPQVVAEVPATANAGDLVSISAQAKDTSGIASLVLEVNGSVLTPSSSTPIGEGPYGIHHSFQYQVSEGVHAIKITATDNDGVSVIKDLQIDASGVTSDSCLSMGIDPSAINTYPNWTRTDWRGLPSHAVSGDRMQHEGVAYEALWWTQSVPGSDSSWRFLCNI